MYWLQRNLFQEFNLAISHYWLDLSRKIFGYDNETRNETATIYTPYFEMHYSIDEIYVLLEMSLFVPNDPINKRSAPDRLMACRQIGDTPLPESTYPDLWHNVASPRNSDLIYAYEGNQASMYSMHSLKQCCRLWDKSFVANWPSIANIFGYWIPSDS